MTSLFLRLQIVDLMIYCLCFVPDTDIINIAVRGSWISGTSKQKGTFIMSEVERNMEMENEFQEYVTFHVTAKDGSDVEMAVVDEFDFEDKHYVVGAVVEDDTISDDGRYIYLSEINGEDFTVKQIEKEFDYNRIAQAYVHMEDEEG